MALKYSLKKFSDLHLQELYDVMKLRQKVFVVEQDCPYLDADGKDQLAYHLLGRDQNGQLMTYTRLLPPNTAFSGYSAIGRVINHPAIRGQGEGKILMQTSVACIQELFPGIPIQIGAQIYLNKFYQDLGFRNIGEEYLEDGIPHIHMVYNPNVPYNG